jgi:small nuclear ribonucleoprotein (snRNP)-like protein
MWRRDERGIVGMNLALVIAFALYAVIQLSRVVLAGSQIDDRVKVIITEVGPGSNVSRLDETQKLNETGRMAEEILTAAQNLSARAGTIIDTAGSIDGTVSQILQNATEINGTVRSIDSVTKQLLPVVQNIHGDETISAQKGGVAAINKRAAIATPVVGGIQLDLNRSNVLGTLVSVDKHAVAICKSVVVGTFCPGVAGPVADPAPNVP